MSFAPLSNDTFLRACRRQATDYTPLWLMRQAGRYLPEYKATRAKAGSFMGLATNVDYATEVTLQPLDRFPLDAAILFSDILTVPDAMGLGLTFAEGEGPRFAKVVRNEADVAELAVPDMDKLRYVFDAVTSIRRALNGRVPLIGFAGSPWTLACYMVEGAGSDSHVVQGLGTAAVHMPAWDDKESFLVALGQGASAVRQRVLCTYRPCTQLWDPRGFSFGDQHAFLVRANTFAPGPGGRIYLDFGSDWRSDFTVVVPPRLAGKTPEDIAKILSLRGARVRVRGWIERRYGPAIEVRDLAEIERLD